MRGANINKRKRNSCQNGRGGSGIMQNDKLWNRGGTFF